MDFVLKQLVIGIILEIALFGGLLFLPAGTLAWWRAWIFLSVVMLASAATMLIVFPGREELLRERMKPLLQEGQPLADKIVLLLFVFAYGVAILMAPLDVFHFHWFEKPHGLVSASGLSLFCAGWTIISLTFKENAFAAPVVKYQEERHQSVVDTGVYSFVRHPMYTGFSLVALGMGLWLESYAAALAALFPILMLMIRITIEENFLREKLAGYADYTQRVRYRLIPYVW